MNCESTLLVSHPQQLSYLTILLQDRDTPRLSLHQKKISWIAVQAMQLYRQNAMSGGALCADKPVF